MTLPRETTVQQSHSRGSAAIAKKITEHGGLVNRAGIARLLAVSPQWANRMVKGSTFPEPVAHVAGKPLWLARDVVDWHDAKRARRFQEDIGDPWRGVWHGDGA